MSIIELNSLYPPSIIIKNNFYLNSIVDTVGNIFSALAAVFLLQLDNIDTVISIICICLAIIGLILSPLIFKKYLHVLKTSVSRLSFFMFSADKEQINAIQSLIASDLNSNNFNLMQFGLITPEIFPNVPSKLYKILNSEYDEQTKIAVIKVLEQYSKKQLDIDELIKAYTKPRLLSDKCENLICQLLIETISDDQIQTIREKIQQTKTLSANLLIFTLKHGYSKEYANALEKTIKLATSDDPKKRNTAAIIIGSLGAGVFYDIKIKLLSDTSQMVRTTMFGYLPAKDIYFLLPSMKNLTRNNVSILHRRFDKEEQIQLAERLMQLYGKQKDTYSLSAINFVTTIVDERVEKYIEQLIIQKDNYARTILARKLIRRKNKIFLTENLQKSLYSAIDFEINLIKEYKQLLKSIDIQDLHALVDNRLYHAKNRVIYWYACTRNDHMDIINSINKLNPSVINLDSQEEKDKATEFLLAGEKELKIKQSIELALTNDNNFKEFSLEKCLKRLGSNDSWITGIIQKHLAKGIDDMNLIQKTIALQQTDFFKNLPDEVLYEVAKTCNMSDYAKDETIITEEDLGDSLYIIVDGKVNAYKGERLLGALEPYQCFGEISLLANTPITSTIITQERTTLLAIDKQSFLSITDDFPQILRTIINVVINRLASQVETLKQV